MKIRCNRCTIHIHGINKSYHEMTMLEKYKYFGMQFNFFSENELIIISLDRQGCFIEYSGIDEY